MTRLDERQLHQVLGREEHELLTSWDRERFAGARVLITGAGGSVGGALARVVARCAPESLTLFDHSEYALFRIEQDLQREAPGAPIIPLLGDICRPRSLRQAFERSFPDVVYHAAAYKHVTMTERAVAPAIETNVFGTLNVARVAREYGARLVLISSDKAAQPASVMGATKRFAEMAVMAEESADFRPVAVRFGNILGSSGSLVEVVLDAIREGRPIPLTDPHATRYFMTAREAVSLVMKADLLGLGGEIYWLDMGEPVRILDVIDRLRELAMGQGLRPVPVQVVGLRPGEKQREELTTQGLELGPTPHRRIWKARQSTLDRARVKRILRALRMDLRRGDVLAALQDLAAGVPGYTPSRQAWQQAAGVSVEPLARPMTPEPRTLVA
ncbi:MAG: polysaccharide biosynthesis protein [Vicinamibacterales bacterium]|nr:polysaccharide biosynthesis protein [Vicinamibacterales bacterium]